MALGKTGWFVKEHITLAEKTILVKVFENEFV